MATYTYTKDVTNAQADRIKAAFKQRTLNGVADSRSLAQILDEAITDFIKNRVREHEKMAAYQSAESSLTDVIS